MNAQPTRVRPVVRAALAVTVLAVTVLAGLTGCLNQVGAPPAAPSQAAPVSEPGGAGPATPSATKPTDPTAPGPTDPAVAPTPGTACRAADLVLDSIDGSGAAGSAYETVTVTNAGAGACRLPSVPSLVYTDPAGTMRALPAATMPPTPTPMLVAPGREAQFSLRTVDGYGGYDPSAPACAHPAGYQGIAIQFTSGRMPLPGLTLTVLCDGVDVSGWAPPMTG
ncbi:MAG TPA: DUF4232 domain-containing protein [Rugosimonospora sp.]